MEKDLPIDKQVLLDAFFSGRLDDTGRKRFDEYLEEDAAFREEYEFQTEIKKALQHQDIAAFRDQLHSIEAKLSAGKPNRNALWIWMSAAVVLLIASVLLYISGKDVSTKQDLYAQYFRPQANIHYPITRNARDASLEYQAYLAYETENWALAANLLDSAMSTVQRPELAFYLANAFMAENRYDDAIPLLEDYRNSGDEYADRASWYLALSHLALGENDSAKSYLVEVVRTQSYPHELASELLAKMQ
jgi:tetratricopeptide (TPR) repeat protein